MNLSVIIVFMLLATLKAQAMLHTFDMKMEKSCNEIYKEIRK